jgi:4-hydroxy-tetrahydrodipicolinate synthase
MFTGLSAFPITPFRNENIDFKAFEALIANLTEANVDSICAMGFILISIGKNSAKWPKLR